MKFQGNQEKQLEMLQLVKFSYEMTAACLKGKQIKNWPQMSYSASEDIPYIADKHLIMLDCQAKSNRKMIQW